MKKFFKRFFKENKKQIIFYSFLRLFSFIQVLFYPYAFSKVLNIISENPKNLKEACLWAVLMAGNSVLEDVVRLLSKLGLAKAGTRLKISLASLFSKETEIKDNKKTGEAVQAIKKASEDIEELVTYYRENILQLPVNLIFIPIILFKASPDYLVLLILYTVLYLIINYFCLKVYDKKLRNFFKAAETFWGTAYRKAPEIWRQREDGHNIADQVDKEGKELYEKEVSALTTNHWMWIFVQTLSSASLGIAVLFVLHKIVNGAAPVGDLILVSAYFDQTQETLNIMTTALNRAAQTRISLRRLVKAVKIKNN